MKKKEHENWETTANRFVGFFDIMGFQEIVERNDHVKVVEKLTRLKKELQTLENVHLKNDFVRKYKISQSRVITFSDSIIFFSKSDNVEDACKIILDASYLIHKSLEIGVAIKGALAWGQITVDFENSVFFGRPIIDSYLLHDILQQYTAVLDNSFEMKLNSLTLPGPFDKLIVEYKANFKTGKITHKLIKAQTDEQIKQQLDFLNKLQETVSGSPRIYIDNTRDFLTSLLPNTN